MNETVALAQYDAACAALAAAKHVDEVQQIRHTAEAMRAYAKQAKNRDLELDAAEIRMRAERRLGELIAQQRDSVGLNQGALPGKTGLKANPVLDERPTLAEAGIDKNLAHRARTFAALEPDDFDEWIRDWRVRMSDGAERITISLLREETREQIRNERPPQPLPSGEYRLLYADPPWRYEHPVSESRAIENQYPTMTLEELAALRVPAAADAVLFLWATSPKLAEALYLIDQWAFVYRTCFVWVKDHIGLGYYCRQQHELLLVAARGEAPVPEPGNRQSSLINAPRGRHSEKPAGVYSMLEAMYPAFTADDRIELFARQARDGWSNWGNELVAG
jgi:N6-adenosine-specific RNA methylase IME4